MSDLPRLPNDWNSIRVGDETLTGVASFKVDYPGWESVLLTVSFTNYDRLTRHCGPDVVVEWVNPYRRWIETRLEKQSRKIAELERFRQVQEKEATGHIEVLERPFPPLWLYMLLAAVVGVISSAIVVWVTS